MASATQADDGVAAGPVTMQAARREAAELESSLVRKPGKIAFVSQDEIDVGDVWRAKWLQQYRAEHESEDRGDFLARFQAPTGRGHYTPAPTNRQAIDIQKAYDRKTDHHGRSRAEAAAAAAAEADAEAEGRAAGDAAGSPSSSGTGASGPRPAGSPAPAKTPPGVDRMDSIHESPSARPAVRRGSRAPGWTGDGSDSDSSSEFHPAATAETMASRRRGTGTAELARPWGLLGNPPVDTRGRMNRWSHERDFGTYELEVDGQAVRRRLVTRSGDVYTREVGIEAPQLFEIEELHRTVAEVAQEQLYACANSGCVRYARSQPMYVVAAVGILVVLYTLTLFGLPGLKLRSAAVSATYLLSFLVTLPVLLSGCWRCFFDTQPGWRVWCRDRFRAVEKDTELDPCCGCGFGWCAERLTCYWCYGCCACLAACCRGLAGCCPGGYQVAGFSDANLAWVAFVVESWYGAPRPPSRLGGSNRLD